MPLKWKIFLALNLVLSLPAFVSFVILFINFLNRYSRDRDYLIIFSFLSGLLLIALNGFLNMYLLQRFFPDKPIPVNIKRLNRVSFVLNIILCIALLLLCIFGTTVEFSESNRGRDTSGKLLLIVFYSLWLVQVVLLFMQGQLPGLINRNNRESMNSLIDSIGQ